MKRQILFHSQIQLIVEMHKNLCNDDLSKTYLHGHDFMVGILFRLLPDEKFRSRGDFISVSVIAALLVRSPPFFLLVTNSKKSKPTMKFFILLVLVLSVFGVALSAEAFPKKEACLLACKLLKKEWQQQLCEVACNQIKADSEFFDFSKILKKLGKKAAKFAQKKNLKIMSDSQSQYKVNDMLRCGRTTGACSMFSEPCGQKAIDYIPRFGMVRVYSAEERQACGFVSTIFFFFLINSFTKSFL